MVKSLLKYQMCLRSNLHDIYSLSLVETRLTNTLLSGKPFYYYHWFYNRLFVG
jgi:hypothetical protein